MVEIKQGCVGLGGCLSLLNFRQTCEKHLIISSRDLSEWHKWFLEDADSKIHTRNIFFNFFIPVKKIPILTIT